MKGFSLIELLVVVLILGILTAVALPQYQKTIEVSRSAEAFTNGKAIIEAQNRALDAFDGLSGDKSDLDIILSGGDWTSNSVYTTTDFVYTLSSAGVTAARTNEAFTLSFHNKDNGGNVTCTGTVCGSLGLEN